MAMSRIRLTLRKAMILVAVVAVGLGGWIVWRRHEHYRDLAEKVAGTAAGLRRMMAKFPPPQLERGSSLDFEDGNPAVPATPEACERFLLHLERVTQQYQRIARFPWLPVPPGTFEPE